MDLYGRNLLKEIDLTSEEFLYLVDLGGTLRTEKRLGQREHRLAGRNIALIFEKASTRTRSAFEVGAHDEGGHVTYLGPEESHLGSSESIRDTARVLGRMYDGIEFRGFTQESVEILGKFAGVPVWNGLTDTWHPTQMLADMLTMRDHAGEPLDAVTYCYLGDGRNNTANSLLVTGAMLGMDARICAPAHLQPSAEVRQIAKALAAESGAQLTISADVTTAVAGADFLYTDVWLSMGEPARSAGSPGPAGCPVRSTCRPGSSPPGSCRWPLPRCRLTVLWATPSRAAISASPAPASRHFRAFDQSAGPSFGFGPDGRASPAAPSRSARWCKVAT